MIKILQFVIPKNKYTLCLVNPEKKDIFNLYIRYSGILNGPSKRHIECEPTVMMTDRLFGESYAILDENHEWDNNQSYLYETLYVSDDGVILQKYYRNLLKNVQTLNSHSLFTTPIWEIEETDYEIIDPEEIIRIVFKDIYAKEAPADSSSYRELLNKSVLFEHFFEDLYVEMDRFYKGDQCFSREKWDFAQILQSNYHVQFVQSEGSDIILSNCSGIMKKLKLSKEQMAEYFIKFLN
ncbi:hypothetical protein [Ureibacillus acetophenoni]